MLRPPHSGQMSPALPGNPCQNQNVPNSKVSFPLSPSVLLPAVRRASSCRSTTATLLAVWSTASPGSWLHLTSHFSWQRRRERRPSVWSSRTGSVRPRSYSSVSATLILLKLSQMTRRRRRMRVVSSPKQPQLRGGAPGRDGTPSGSLRAVLCSPTAGLFRQSGTIKFSSSTGLPVASTSGLKRNLFPS